MKKKSIHFDYTEFDSLEELDKTDRLLLNTARQALSTSYAPYSGFKIGSAVLLDNGKIVVGSNQENASFPSGICGERAAIYAARSLHPDHTIKVIAIANSKQKGATHRAAAPCGQCRQAILEYEHLFDHPIKLILAGDQGSIIIVHRVADLLPLGFGADFL